MEKFTVDWSDSDFGSLQIRRFIMTFIDINYAFSIRFKMAILLEYAIWEKCICVCVCIIHRLVHKDLSRNLDEKKKSEKLIFKSG